MQVGVWENVTCLRPSEFTAKVRLEPASSWITILLGSLLPTGASCFPPPLWLEAHIVPNWLLLLRCEEMPGGVQEDGILHCYVVSLIFSNEKTCYPFTFWYFYALIS